MPRLVVEAAVNPERGVERPYYHNLAPAFELYIGNVSPRSMAIPIETSAFLWWLCVETKAKSVVDLGSGFTSYVLRLYASQCDYPVVVHSVDDDPYWLERSVRFCEFHKGLDLDGFLSDDEWMASDQTYDVIVHDMASGDKRNEFAGHAADRLNAGGHLLLDDAQNHSHHHAFSDVCRYRGMTLVDIWAQTIEEAGRFAALAVKP